jgi:hypothetical protein
MQKHFKLVVDTFSEVHDLLAPYADAEFWDFGTHEVIPGAVYLISRKEFSKHSARIRQIVESGLAHVIFSNPAEGGETLIGQVRMCGIVDLAAAKRIPLLGGGAMDDRWSYLEYASFMPKILDYDENIIAQETAKEIYTKIDKPYKFLFLNGRTRPHRKYLLERFDQVGLLDQCIWTNLDNKVVTSRHIKFMHNEEDLMYRPRAVNYLDSKYEVDRYRANLDLPKTNSFVKYELFQDTWGEIYIEPAPYIDTYFSLVTETLFDYPYSFRTEKIWKPIVMGHPWIAVANQGYYRDIKNTGYRTFGHLIDESFDHIDNSQDRIERIAQVVEDLCKQDLTQFLSAVEEVCKYNRQHYAEQRLQVRNEFPERFFQFVNQNFNFNFNE